MSATIDKILQRQELIFEMWKRMINPQINIECKPNDLLTAIKSVLKIVPEKPRHPILATILLKTENNKIIVTSSDLTSFMEAEVPGEVLKNGAICVGAALFKNLIEAIDGDEIAPKALVNIRQVDEREIEISYKRYRAKLYHEVVCEDHHFPVYSPSDGEEFSVPNLEKHFSILKPFTKSDPLNPKFSGITVTKNHLIASNGSELAAITGLNNPVECVIPVSVPLNLLVEPTIKADENFITFTDNNKTITSELIKQKIDLDQISIPTKLIGSFNIKEMLNQLPLFFGVGGAKKTNEVYPVWIDIKNGITLRSSQNETEYKLQSGISQANIALYIEIRQFIKVLKVINNSADVVELYADSDRSLVAVKKDNFLIGFMPLPIIKNNMVVAHGCGYETPSMIPYNYSIENKCLTVEYSKGEYLKAEYIGYNPDQKVAQMKKEAEEKAAWKECFDDEPQELLTAAINHESAEVEKLLKDHHKTLSNFKSTRFGAKQKGWKEAVRSYIYDVNKWYQP